MSTTLQAVLVRGSDGIDVEATVARFTTQLEAFKAEQELEGETIAAAVHAVFDQYPGANIAMPALAGSALRALNVQPQNYKAMEDKVLGYIRENSDRLANAKKGVTAEPERTRLFGIQKGAGGGVCRWSDVPVETESK